jgi:hypothetical protein
MDTTCYACSINNIEQKKPLSEKKYKVVASNTRTSLLKGNTKDICIDHEKFRKHKCGTIELPDFVIDAIHRFENTKLTKKKNQSAKSVAGITAFIYRIIAFHLLEMNNDPEHIIKVYGTFDKESGGLKPIIDKTNTPVTEIEIYTPPQIKKLRTDIKKLKEMQNNHAIQYKKSIDRMNEEINIRVASIDKHLAYLNEKENTWSTKIADTLEGKTKTNRFSVSLDDD